MSARDTTAGGAVMDLAELIERVEALDGPDREVDALVEIELRRQQAYQVGLNDEQRAKWRPVGGKGEVEEGGARYHSPVYTASLDAAVALVDRALPGSWYLIGKGKTRATEPLYGAQIMFGSDEVIGEGEHDASPSIALVLATLKAMEKSQ